MKMRMLLLVAAALFVPVAGASYKCVDEKGVTRIGDTPPPECDHVPMYEMSSTGAVRRKIDPTPTADQLKTRLDEQEKAKEAERAAAEQKRKDVALLASYSNEKEFDVARERNIEPIVGRLKTAQDRSKEVDKRIHELDDEMEFYRSGKSGKNAKSGKNNEPPPVLVANMDRAKAEKVSLEKSVVDYNAQIEAMKQKYDVDKKRWIALKTGTVERPNESLPPEAQSKAPAKKP
jgi:chromosome segregation ATPase